MPNVDASAIDAKPSIVDLVINSCALPLIPSSIAPSIVIEPIQNSKKAVIKPSVKLSFLDFNL